MAGSTDGPRAGDFPALLAAARGALHAHVEAEAGGPVRVRVPLPDGRTQVVRIAVEDDTLRFTTRCGEAVLAHENPGLFRVLLAKNATLKHGFFALAADGAIELVATQHLATCDSEEFTLVLTNLATVGDFLERELTRGAVGEKLDLY